jgi:hypothetical protein
VVDFSPFDRVGRAESSGVILKLCAMITNILYTIAFFIMLALTYSYGFAFFLTKKIHIFGLFFFVTAMTVQIFAAIWQLYSKAFFGEVSSLPFRAPRATFICLAAGFLLYTTWKKNNVK